jgi:hypothetical protein
MILANAGIVIFSAGAFGGSGKFVGVAVACAKGVGVISNGACSLVAEHATANINGKMHRRNLCDANFILFILYLQYLRQNET